MPAACRVAIGIETEKIFVLASAFSGTLSASEEFMGVAYSSTAMRVAREE
jgi:hypothetical protein